MPLPPAVSTGQRGELATVAIAGARSRLELAAHGAHLLTWEPAHTRPVLFVSPQSKYTPGKAIRGGVPLVFPWFGPKARDTAAAQHGFARVRAWRIAGARVEPDGTAVAELLLTDDAATRSVWPHRFEARLVVRAARELRLELHVRNMGDAPFRFEAAFHSYFAVSDVRAIGVDGLAQTEFVERYGEGVSQRQGPAPITFGGEVDRTYFDTAATCTIEDPGWKRRIAIAKSGSNTTVVWNPGVEKARAMADLGESAWTGFVCVETVCAGHDAVALSPGQTHRLACTVNVEQVG